MTINAKGSEMQAKLSKSEKTIRRECKYAVSEGVYSLEGTTWKYWQLRKWRVNGGRWCHVRDGRVKSVAGFKAWLDYETLCD